VIWIWKKKNSSAIELSMLEEEPTKIALHDDDVLSAKPKLSNQCIFYRKLNLKSSRNDNFQDFALIFRIPESLEDKEEENITSNLDDSTNILNLSTKNIGSRNKHPELPIPLFPLTPKLLPIPHIPISLIP